ncbi:MAG: flagellar biosynthesis protein FlhF [Planctomycetota bacterium]
MPVELKTYHAYTMAEALAAVKRDLGPAAVILHTRTFHRGGMLGIGRKLIVEVTATAEDAPAGPRMRRVDRALQLKQVAARSAYRPGPTTDRAAGEIPAEPSRRVAAPGPPRHRRKRSCRTAPGPVQPPKRPDPPPGDPAPEIRTTIQRPAEAGPAPGTRVAPVARRFILTPDKGHQKVVTPPTEADLVGAGGAASRQPAPGGGRQAGAEALEGELVAIRQLVGRVLQNQVTGAEQPSSEMPQVVFDHYLRLIGQELSEELADHIVRQAQQEVGETGLGDEAAVRESVLRHLAGCVPVADPAVPRQSPDGRPLTIALVGPTGVGKTTTVAKLAASFKLRLGRRVGLITADTYRIAAVDQLRTYANIVGLPLYVALTPSDVSQAVHALADQDVILIDTAGRGHNDGQRLEELGRIVAAASPHEVHLVLSSTASERVLLQEAQAFGPVGVHKIVLTKLDEAVSFGMLINVVRQVGKQLSFITTGQEVPDHIEVGRRERLAGLVMGEAIRA